MKILLLLSLLWLSAGEFVFGEEIAFEKLTLTEEFHSEGIAVADLDRDGHSDIISGPFWYRGPEFRTRQRYMPGDALAIQGYSRHFFTWTHDFNDDGFIDILTVGMPGEPAFWFRHPGNELETAVHWHEQQVHDDISNESPEFVDIDGDNIPELVCIHRGAFGYIKHRLERDQVDFSFTPITPNLNYGRFTHGMGVGDVDGDGKADLLETNGWWQQQEVGELFKFHPHRFAQSGGAQVFAYDFDGDGDNDVVCSQNAHGFGMNWFEQQKHGDKREFVPHMIMSDQPADNPYGIAVSQMHAAGLVDIDGDGIKDIVTGKRYWAHGGKDPGAEQLPLLFWLKTIRSKGRVIFQPHLIDTRSGVGTQVTVSDVNLDGKTDVVVGNKLGSFLFLQSDREPSLLWDHRSLVAGTGLFRENVRTTEPLSPDQQVKTFTLPQGFDIQLVASEPDIAKPMNLAFDEQGRLWVSSSREYPFAAKGGTLPRDAIKILEDVDGDGRAEVVKTFADGLNIPMGLLPYGDGVICFSVPNIWYLHDTDGDDQADKREILYGPFDTTNDTHGMCNSFELGNDGWIYACHGFSNQSEVSGKDGHTIKMDSGNVFRFKPDGSRIELVSRGQVNPFGLTIDSNGDVFTADCHTKPINLVLPGGHHDSFGKPHDGLGYIPEVMDHLHNSTGIGGIALGEYSHFPPVYQRSTFGGNVVTGRINRNHLIYQGSSMRAREESDFLIPSDPWFRPVHLQFGPDGALYIADFYNRIIGHYEVDLDHPGRDRHRGRIWKVVFNGHQGRRDASLMKRSTVRTTQDQGSRSQDIGSQLRQLNLANRTQSRVVEKRIRETLDRNGEGTETLFLALQQILQKGGDENANAVLCANNVLRSMGRSDLSRRFILQLHESEKMNCHLFQMIANKEGSDWEPDEIRGMLRLGLAASSPLVRRFAALAAAKHAAVDVTFELTQQLNETIRTEDRFLVHALKIALRQQGQWSPDRLLNASKLLEPTSIPAFAEICLAIKTPASAKFILDNLDSLVEQAPSGLNRYLEFAATHSNAASIDRIVDIVAARYQEDPEFQLQILKSLRVGVESSQLETPESIKRMAAEIAQKLLGAGSAVWHLSDLAVSDLAGTDSAGSDSAGSHSAGTVPFAVRQLSRNKGQQALYIDTRTRGESLTGLLQSVPFVLTDKFEFSIAGHDSTASSPQEWNFAKLLLVEGERPVETVRVPANDIAQDVAFDTSAYRGKKAFLQVWDQCPADAYAWIAVGDFRSHPQLDPSAGWHVERVATELQWSFHAQEFPAAQSADENIFVVSTRRKSEDGMQKTPLWSSIVHGEKKVGVYRSEPFDLDAIFSFYMAGHDGLPEQPGNEANYVQLRLADTGSIIQKSFPPRNDTARRYEWDTEKWQGQRAFIEMVDQDSSGSFAWLAAGRFSVSGLNPSQRLDDRLLASQIIADFGLQRLREDVVRLLQVTKSNQLRSQLCKTLIQLKVGLESKSIFDVAAELLVSKQGKSVPNRDIIDAVIVFDLASIRGFVSKAIKTMSTQQQSSVAELLSVDKPGAAFLIELIEAGIVSASVLRNTTLVEKLRTHQKGVLNSNIEQLVRQIPKTNPELISIIGRRKNRLLTTAVNAGNGRKIFEKNCANCHQIGGRGVQVGPNLDGVGNRGLDRLLSDILVPNENVDASFRASLISTVDGRVLNGFARKSNADSVHVTLVDAQGKSMLIRRDEIEAQKLTTVSPMPANFHETISESDFGDLLGYLLDNRK